MYAIMQSGSKQYRVEEGDIIDVELLGAKSEVKPGQAHVFKEVLFVQEESKAQVGLPFVEGCVVQGEILGETKGPKVISFKIKRRKNCRKKIGHRQKYARVRITAIGAADKKPKEATKKAAAPKAEVKTEAKPAAKKAAPKKAATPKAEAKPAAKKAVASKKPAAKKTAPKAAAKKPATKKKKES